jgi:hypothetical protein
MVKQDAQDSKYFEPFWGVKYQFWWIKGQKKSEFRLARSFVGLAASFDAPMGDCYTFIINLSGMVQTTLQIR